MDDRATYLLIVRFAQVWLPQMETLSPAAALAAAQQWLRTRTVADLKKWRATEVPPVSTEKREAAETDAEREDELVGARKGATQATRGRGNRYDIEQAESRMRASMERAGDDTGCPYADPIYWAGFQIYGW